MIPAIFWAANAFMPLWMRSHNPFDNVVGPQVCQGDSGPMDSNEPNDNDVDCKAWNLQAVNDAHSMAKHDYSEANTCSIEYVDNGTLAVKNKVYEKMDSQ